MDVDQLMVLFIGILFLVGGVGFLFVSVDEGAEERDKKRGLVPDLPRTHPFSRYFLFQVGWYKWFTAGILLVLAAVFISHAFSLLDRFLY